MRVAVDAITDRPERTFDYLVPPGWDVPPPGSLLLVPYGRRVVLGYALASEQDAPVPDADLREIESVVGEPILTGELLGVAERVATHYRAPLGMTISAMLPAGLESRLERRWQVTDPTALPDDVRAAVDADGMIADADLRRGVRETVARPMMERLRRRGAIRAAWTLRRPAGGPVRVTTLRAVARPADASPLRGARQRALAELIGPVPRTIPELADELGVEAGTLMEPARALERRGIAELGWREVERDPLAHRVVRPAMRHALAAEQASAAAAIDALPPGGEALLQGVAAGGKTEVYLAAAETALARGEDCVLLVPEISLVTQLADRVRATFGDAAVAVMHSGLSAGERHDTWWRILRGGARIVLGTRMAVFAPMPRLGLIVIDEEHDGAYKQDRAPRYDARWVARRRAEATGARLVLGTATPEMVTYHRAVHEGGVHLALLERRAGRAPTVELVDMRAELAAGERSIFSRPLQASLAELRPGVEQAILLMNRRGASTFVLCRDCGFSLRCPECDLPFVYHLDGSLLRCHHCGRTAAVPSVCPSCGGVRIRYFGAGTQRVEAELRRLLPSLRAGRLDSDAIARRRGYESVYDDFSEGRLDVLVGTQMVAKGLDLPRVTVVGVVAADVTLNLPDYRAAERTFQLVAQVTGRAGRGPRPGRVIVQTYAPEHYALRAAAKVDVDGFAAEELARRRLLGYPPFALLARLAVADPDRSRAEERAAMVRDAVASEDVEALGPLPTYVPRRAGRWWMQVVLRAADEESRRAALERVPPGVVVDVDPESLL